MKVFIRLEEQRMESMETEITSGLDRYSFGVSYGLQFHTPLLPTFAWVNPRRPMVLKRDTEPVCQARAGGAVSEMTTLTVTVWQVRPEGEDESSLRSTFL